MQLKRINHYIGQYKRFLESPEADTNLYIWESQFIFQEEWDEDHEDWGEMYSQALQNSTTRRLWNRQAYEPKAMMLKFIRFQPDYVRQMFLDLYNEDKALEGRLSRFVFYCDQLLEAYREEYPTSRDNKHYHDDDYHMGFLYLAFRYPEKYALYDAQAFKRLLIKLGSKNIPQANDVERFAKVVATLYKFLQKEEDIVELHRQRLQEGKHYNGESMLLVYDFYHCITQAWKGLEGYPI